MKNIRTLLKFQKVDTIDLILVPEKDGVLRYYVCSSSINYKAIAYGVCRGYCQGTLLLNISLGSIIRLFERGYDLYFMYDNGLTIENKDRSMVFKPQYSILQNDSSLQLVKKLMQEQENLENYELSSQSLQQLESDKKNLQMELDKMTFESYVPPSNPFGEYTPIDTSKQDKMLEDIEESEAKIKHLMNKMSVIDFKQFSNIIYAASKFNEVVHFCDDYAVTGSKDSFIIQKGYCCNAAIPGNILNALLSLEGRFFNSDQLCFLSTRGKDRLAVFFEKTLSNPECDLSLLSRGKILEKYIVDLKSVITMAPMLSSKFPELTFDFDSKKAIYSNSLESVLINLNIKEYTTEAIERIKSGEDNVEVNFSSVILPKSVQSIIGILCDDIKVIVKKNKVILGGNGFYIIIGR